MSNKKQLQEQFDWFEQIISDLSRKAKPKLVIGKKEYIVPNKYIAALKMQFVNDKEDIRRQLVDLL